MERHIVSPEVEAYLRAFYPPEDALMAEMRKDAKENRVPIIEPESARFLHFLVSVLAPRRILEIGTAIGTSAITMMRAMKGNTEIYTIERDYFLHERAKKYFGRTEYTGFHPILGDALDIVPEMEMDFDLIFVDGAKAQNHNFFFLADRRVKPGGVIVFDNVLYRGMIADDALYERRSVTIIKRLRTFLEEAHAREDYTVSLVPVGDGMLLCRKENE